VENVWPVLVGILIVGASVVAIAFAARHERERRRIWKGLALARGLDFRDATGPWYRPTAASMEGLHEGVEVRVDTHTTGSGKQKHTWTRVTTRLPRPLAGKVVVTRRNLFSSIGKLVGMQDVEVGAREFDEQLIVQSQPEPLARSVLVDDVRAAILAFPRSLRLECEGGEVRLRWLRAERDKAVLEGGLRVVSATARACART